MLRMKIAVVHSFYSDDAVSGENLSVAAQVEARRSAGLEVMLVSRRTTNLQTSRGRMYAPIAALTVATGLGDSPAQEIADFGPDVVHIHNLFPNFGWRWTRAMDVPIVVTMHNFRYACAGGYLYRNGAICRDCCSKGPLRSVQHGCYAGSRLRTLPLLLGGVGDVRRYPLGDVAAAIVFQSNLDHQLAVENGLKFRRARVIPNFLEDWRRPVTQGPTSPRWLVLGRATPEKGMIELLKAWPPDVALDVFTDDTSLLRPFARGRINVLPRVGPDEVRVQLPQYTGLVVPSRWFESGVPRVALEAMEAGVPLVARTPNAVTQLIEAAPIGSEYRADTTEAIAQAIEAVHQSGFAQRLAARAYYESHHSVRAWQDGISSLYQEVASTGGAISN